MYYLAQTIKLENTKIHTDIYLNESDGSNKKCWKKMLFGINWELFSENTFSWWDMSALPECWPDAGANSLKYNYLNGIHYVKRFNVGIPDGAIKLEETLIDGPTLIRTDIPHATVYKNSIKNRIGISIRFDESDFIDWNSVTDLFKIINKQ